jgi:hypothetical protein
MPGAAWRTAPEKPLAEDGSQSDCAFALTGDHACEGRWDHDASKPIAS